LVFADLLAVLKIIGFALEKSSSLTLEELEACLLGAGKDEL